MARKDVASIMSGAGWTCDFVGQLISGLVAKGHTSEEIHSLVTSKSRLAMEKIVDEVSNFIYGIGSILRIDRTTPFNPVQFLGQGWSIWRGPANGNSLSCGEEDQDERSFALTEVNLLMIRFETCLQKGEISITGEEKLCRLKASGHIRLDAKIFQTLWENKDRIPESWKEKINNNTRFIFFDGTVLRSPFGHRYVLCLYWLDGEWNWSYDWLKDVWLANVPSAVLAS